MNSAKPMAPNGPTKGRRQRRCPGERAQAHFRAAVFCWVHKQTRDGEKKQGNDERVNRLGHSNTRTTTNDDEKGKSHPAQSEPPVVPQSQRRYRRAARRGEYAVPVRHAQRNG